MADVERPVLTSTLDVSYVEWSAVIAGAFLAAALSFVLLVFGSTIGLTATSPWPNSGLPAGLVAALAVFWAMAQQIASFLAGGYVAGRMRSRWGETRESEAEFRDGLHGGLVWAVGVVIGAALLFATAGGVARTGVNGASSSASTVAANANASDLVVDRLLRPQSATQQPSNPSDARTEVARILTNAMAARSLSSEDRAYLARLVAQQTGISAEEADKRIAQADAAAREAVDKARKAAVLAGFVTAASLLLSLAAAWWAAIQGGNHRDHQTPAHLVGRRRAT